MCDAATGCIARTLSPHPTPGVSRHWDDASLSLSLLSPVITELMPDRSATRLAWTRRVLADPRLGLESASADASFRSYWRTQHRRTQLDRDGFAAGAGGSRAVAGDRRPSRRGRPARAEGARARICEQGFLLIEDLGSRTVSARPGRRHGRRPLRRCHGRAAAHAARRRHRGLASRTTAPFLAANWRSCRVVSGRHLGHATGRRGNRRAGGMRSSVLVDKRTGTAALLRASRLPQPQPADRRRTTARASSTSRARCPARSPTTWPRCCAIATSCGPRERVEAWVETIVSACGRPA